MAEAEAEVTQAEAEPRSLARSSLVMVGGSFASRALGVVRAGLLTAIIGTLAAGDAFNLANTLPNVFYILAAGGILNAVLIPALTRAMKLPDGGQEFTDRVVTVALIAMGGITILVLLGAGAFVSLLSGNRGSDFERLALAFSFICLPQIFFYGAFALFGQILNAKHRFGAFAWAPFVANVVAVAGLLLFIAVFPAPQVVNAQGQPLARPPDQWTGPMIWLFAGSATVSVIAQAAWLLPALYRTGFRYRPRWGLRGVGLGGVSRLALWAFVGLAVSQIGFFITQWVLNTAAARSGRPPDDPLRATSVYTVAFTIFMLPHAFIAVSIITALFPRLSKAAADDDVATAAGDGKSAARSIVRSRDSARSVYRSDACCRPRRSRRRGGGSVRALARADTVHHPGWRLERHRCLRLRQRHRGTGRAARAAKPHTVAAILRQRITRHAGRAHARRTRVRRAVSRLRRRRERR